MISKCSRTWYLFCPRTTLIVVGRASKEIVTITHLKFQIATEEGPVTPRLVKNRLSPITDFTLRRKKEAQIPGAQMSIWLTFWWQEKTRHLILTLMRALIKAWLPLRGKMGKQKRARNLKMTMAAAEVLPFILTHSRCPTAIFKRGSKIASMRTVKVVVEWWMRNSITGFSLPQRPMTL